ncbi:MAG TPA: bifunctional phosphoribosyl-AMP cyclohydrolase/phosphoribosyl-ATP diphosphatase HisIE [Pyrinomonadaceae bacterium]|nr:bifunctional phosphoribosyl-AMP cyclohydrolase/phosphoribosyl-ATP diphosphatase HisIE [Pyrinomonadaceae bacterium]
MNLNIEEIRFGESGLIPAIVQDARTREVLTLAYMNAESLEKTLESRETWFWSRSRSELWHKGATSGNTQRVTEIRQDCDSDALVVLVEPAGPACHTGKRSCFYRDLKGDEVNLSGNGTSLGSVLNELYDLIESRLRDRPDGSYTTYLFEQGLDKILKKLGEEASETIIAAKNDEKGPLVSESADLLYHLIVLLVGRGVTLDQVKAELISRRTKGTSS